MVKTDFHQKWITLGLIFIAFWQMPPHVRAEEGTGPTTEQANQATAIQKIEQDIESHLGREVTGREERRIDNAFEGHARAVNEYESLSETDKNRLHTLWDRKYAKARALNRNPSEPDCSETAAHEKRERFFCTNAGFAQVVGVEVYACKRRSGQRFFLTQAKLGLGFEAHAGVFMGRGNPEEGVHFGTSGGLWILAGAKSITFDGVSGFGIGVGAGIEASASVFVVQNIQRSTE